MMNELKSLAGRCAEQLWLDDKASQFLGMAIEKIEEGEAVIRFTVRKEMVNGHDICHGGYIFTLADSAFAFACNSFNQVAVAASCSIEFIRPAHLGDQLRAAAKVVHQGKRSGIYDVEVTNESGAVVAQFRGRSARLGRPVIEMEEKA